MKVLQPALPSMRLVAADTLHRPPPQITHRFVSLAAGDTKMGKLGGRGGSVMCLTRFAGRCLDDCPDCEPQERHCFLQHGEACWRSAAQYIRG